MSTNQHYKSNLRDIQFNLFNSCTGLALGKGPYANMDYETSKDILTNFEAMCREEFSSSFVNQMEYPSNWIRKHVDLPEGLTKQSIFYEQQWNSWSCQTFGSYGIPRSVYWLRRSSLLGEPSRVLLPLGNLSR